MANPFIKKAHIESEFTAEMVRELQRCATDPVYCIKNYFWIQHPIRGRVRFVLYPFQEELIWSLHNNRDLIVLASRQMGKCFSANTSLNIIKKPNKFKMLLLYILARDEYEKVKKL